MKKNNQLKLYNMIFPIWLLWIVPVTWIVVLPANFIIDLLVIVITLKVLKVANIKLIVKEIVLKVWLFGFLSDFIGTSIMLLASIIDFNNKTLFGKWWYDNITNAVTYDPFQNVFSLLWITIAFLITAFFIYFFNYKICLKKADMTDKIKKKLSLSLAIFTAPYLFYLPTSWFFH